MISLMPKDSASRFIHDLSTPLTTISLLVENLATEARGGAVEPATLVQDLEQVRRELDLVQALVARMRQQIG